MNTRSQPHTRSLVIIKGLALMLLTQGVRAHSADYYVAGNGVDTNPGTSVSPFATITRAQSAASFGDTVYLRGGTYSLSNAHLTYTNSVWASVNHITKDGIRYRAYPGERPVFDFTDVKPPGWRVTAFLIDADDCVFEGFDIVGVQVTITNGTPGVSNTQSECFRVNNGSRNRFERLAMHDGMGIGWYLVRGQSNLVLNCDAYNNRGLDSLSMGNVDGFGIHGNSTSHTGNVLSGCRAWFNSDDGFDLINCDAPAVIENCWAFYNGYFTNFTSSGGDGHGFKSGGYGRNGSSIPMPVPRHVTRFCLAVSNRVSGFYANHHTGGLDWIGNTAIGNGANYNMLCTLPDNLTDVDGYDHYMKNNLGWGGGVEVIHLGPSNDVSHNYFTLPVDVTASDFESLVRSLLTQPRPADGRLPEVAFARPAGESEVVDAGLDLGFAFEGAAPDLGAFEFGAIHRPSFDAIAVLSGGEVRLTFSGLHGQDYEIRAATNAALSPVTSWDLVESGTLGASAVIHTDATATNCSARFYVLRVP